MGSYGNQFSPVGYAGLPNGAPPGYLDKPFSYVYDVVLTANQALLSQSVPIQTDSEFYLRGIYVSAATGTFTFRYSDANNYYFSDAQLLSQSFSTFAGQPTIVLPEVWYPAGGKLSIDITDTSGSGNTVELVFVGVKRYAQ
jgi:hypothetical protein